MKDIDLFDDFTNGRLDKSQSENFTNRLKSDAEFKADFENYLSTVDLVKIEGFRSEVEEVFNNKPPNSSIKKIWLAIGILSILAYLVYQYSIKNEAQEVQHLFANYYEPYPNIKTFRSDQSIAEGLEAYSLGEYQAAISRFESLNDKSDIILFYEALSNLSLDNFNRDQYLNLVDQIPIESQFRPQLTWYTALSFLRNPIQVDSSLLYLKKIDQSFKFQESLELINQIEDSLLD